MSGILTEIIDGLESLFAPTAEPAQPPVPAPLPSIPFNTADLDTSARTLYGEIRNGDLRAIQAVAWVIRNRASWRPAAWWGSTPKDVCLHPYQFSCWNANDPNRSVIEGLPRTDARYNYHYAVSQQVFLGEVSDPTRGATMYKVTGTPASWDHAVAGVPPVIVGPHSFWRLGPKE